MVLSRKPNERILIGGNVKITILRIGPTCVRLGIDAPRDVKVIREELDGVREGEAPAEPYGVEIDLEIVGQLLTGVLGSAGALPSRLDPIVDLCTCEAIGTVAIGTVPQRRHGRHKLVRLTGRERREREAVPL